MRDDIKKVYEERSLQVVKGLSKYRVVNNSWTLVYDGSLIKKKYHQLISKILE